MYFLQIQLSHFSSSLYWWFFCLLHYLVLDTTLFVSPYFVFLLFILNYYNFFFVLCFCFTIFYLLLLPLSTCLPILLLSCFFLLCTEKNLPHTGHQIVDNKCMGMLQNPIMGRVISITALYQCQNNCYWHITNALDIQSVGKKKKKQQVATSWNTWKWKIS